jgi:hypothetical protein
VRPRSGSAPLRECRFRDVSAKPLALRVTTPTLFTDSCLSSLHLLPGFRSSALGGYGERILDSPVIVEGYSDGDEVNERLAASRHRAILVRNYLQSHFSLDTSSVGTVALENHPPAGSSRTSWNGVAIVLLKVKR